MNLKSFKINHFYTLFFLVFILLSSCSIQKKKYSKGYTFQSKRLMTHSSSVDDSEIIFEDNKKNKSDESISTLETTQDVIAEKMEASISLGVENTLVVPRIKRLASQLAEDCDVLTTMEGVEISCIVVEILISEIKYKKCGFEDGPTISIKRNDVFMIKYRNGEKDVIIHEDEPVIESVPPREYVIVEKNNANEEKAKVDGLGIAAFVLSIIGGFIPFYYVGLAFIALGLLLGLISLGNIERSDGKKKGRGFGLAAFFLSLLWGIVVLILLL